LKAKPYLEAITEMMSWLKSVDVAPVESHIAKRLAIQIVNAGFTNWQHLDGLFPGDLLDLDAMPCDVALLSRAVDAARVAAKLARSRTFAAPSGVALPHALASADAFAASMRPEVLEQAEADFHKEAAELGAPGLGVTLRPAQAILALASARSVGRDVDTCLMHRASLLKLETRRKSLSVVASGLKSWHAFAHAVLGYPSSGTLPPRSSHDMMKFVTLFKVAATGANYVGYVRWTCVNLGLSVAWFDDELKLTLKGARKMAVRCGSTSAVARQLLDEVTLAKVVELADSRGLSEWSCLALLSWEFLLRVQSEALELQVGTPDDATALPSGRHSGLWLDSSGSLVLRLQRRKHRPMGSVLKRRCLCASVGPKRCVVHRAGQMLQSKPVGSPLFKFSAKQFLDILRSLLGEVGAQFPLLHTLKTFRAGKATALAEAGAPLGQILAAGEWKSKAFLNYVDEDVFDSVQFLSQAMENSDDE
jgi:hypothetical protein